MAQPERTRLSSRHYHLNDGQVHRWLSRNGYGLGLLVVFLLSLGLRFWSLDRFNQLAFDEIYYVQYGLDYLEGRSLFDAHPPLGKYLIAAGIWLGDHLLFSHLSADQHLFNDASGQLLSPYSYRWLNAAVGSTLPLLLAGVARQLTGQRLVGLLAAGLIALDGLFLVESRFALLHVYLVAFGLLGNWCWLRAVRAPAETRWRWLLVSGLALGACVSVKWNGLGYGLGPVVLSLAPRKWRLFARVSGLQVLLFLVILPGLVYTLLWLPHLRLNPEVGLIQLHQQLLGFHQGNSVTGSDIHDYCSPWWSWPLMIRPIAYALSKGGEPSIFFAVYALGNPLLWWGSAIAIAGVFVRVAIALLTSASSLSLNVGLYLFISFAANWLPWAAVERCTFVYHYLGALSFGTIALAWGLGWAWQQRGDWRWASAGVLGLVAIAFCFWLPLWLGLPLSEQAFRARLILPSWP